MDRRLLVGRERPRALHNELAAIGVVPTIAVFSPSDCTVPIADVSRTLFLVVISL